MFQFETIKIITYIYVINALYEYESKLNSHKSPNRRKTFQCVRESKVVQAITFSTNIEVYTFFFFFFVL